MKLLHMRSYLFLSVLFLVTALQAEVLLGWHTPGVTLPDSTPDTAAAGVAGTLSGGSDAQATDGSTDGTYGTVSIPGSPTTANRIRVRDKAVERIINIVISNTSGSDLVLGKLVFDYDGYANAPQTATIKYVSGDLAVANGTQIGNAIPLTLNGGLGSTDFPDYAASIDSLSDYSLANGESATFSITFTGALASTSAGAIDNIAITQATTDPPPVTETGPAPLIVWHSGSLSADVFTNVVSAVLSIDGTGGTSGTHGSTDGSYGNYNTNAPVTGGAFGLVDGDAIEITLVNHMAGRLLLEDLHLDFNRRDSSAPNHVTVSYTSGDLDDAAITLGSLSNQSVIASDLADFRDLDMELRQKLFDTVLDEGESAVFRIAVSGASGSTTSYVDHIAIEASLTNYIGQAPASLPTVSSVRKPNVVVFYADDLGIGDISASGYSTTKISTPNIDALAAQGMRFTDAHTAFATCAPSRYGVLAGSMPFRGKRFNGTFRLEQTPQFKAGQKSMGHLFQSAGYRTAHIGKTHLGGELYNGSGNVVSGMNLSTVDWLLGIANGPTGYLGFDYSFISHDGVQGPQYIYHENDFPVTGFAYNTNTLTWTWSSATSQPYVLLQGGSPSNPGTGDIDLDPDGNGALSEILFDTGSQFIYYGYGDFDTTKTGEIYMQAAKNFIDDHMANHSSEPFYLHYASQAVHIPHTPDVDYFDEPVKLQEPTPHLDMVREMDLQLKMLIDHLEAAGVADDTIIIFTSDNGGIRKSDNENSQLPPFAPVGHIGSGPFRGNKTTPWEGGTMVPFIIRWGDGTPAHSVIPPGTICEQVFSQMDLYPTFATLLDRPQAATQARDGYNVLPYFFGQTATSLRDHLLAAANYQNAYRFSYRLGGWKVITAGPQTYNDADFINHTVVEMYHMASDPYETTDLSADPDYAEIKARAYASLLDRTLYSTRSTPALDSDADGLFDEWENRVAGNLTSYNASLIGSAVDSDNDGVSDGDEYVIRSNPGVADAFNGSIVLSALPDNLSIAWESKSGRFYDLQKNTNLVDGAWNSMGTYPGNGGMHEVDVPIENDDGFYRTVIEP